MAVLARLLCLVVGALLVGLGLANALSVLPQGQLAGFTYLAGGSTLLRFVGSGFR